MTKTVKPIKVMLVEDHTVVSAGLRELLNASEKIEVIGEAQTGEGAIELLDEISPHVVVMDINMPGIGGVETIRRIKKNMPHINIIALTVYESAPFPEQVFAAGGQGFLSKQCIPEELIQAIDMVMAGKSYLSSSVSKKITEYNQQADVVNRNFTKREYQVFHLLVQGKKISQIAGALNLSYKTVHHHRKSLMDKANVTTDFDLINIGRTINLLEGQ